MMSYELLHITSLTNSYKAIQTFMLSYELAHVLWIPAMSCHMKPYIVLWNCVMYYDFLGIYVFPYNGLRIVTMYFKLLQTFSMFATI